MRLPASLISLLSYLLTSSALASRSTNNAMSWNNGSSTLEVAAASHEPNAINLSLPTWSGAGYLHLSEPTFYKRN